jgi:hypothetical protein
MTTEELSCRAAEVDGIATVEVRGELTVRSSAVTLVPVLRKLLLDRGRLLVDVRGAGTSWPAALACFPSVLARAGGWPLARMVLWGASADLAMRLRASAITATVPLGGDRAEALALLDRRPRRVRRTTRLPATPDAAAFARSLIRAACDDWAVDRCGRQGAVLVGNELVSNAVQHAKGPSLLTLGLDERGHECLRARRRSPVRRGGAGGTAPRPARRRGAQHDVGRRGARLRQDGLGPGRGGRGARGGPPAGDTPDRALCSRGPCGPPIGGFVPYCRVGRLTLSVTPIGAHALPP